MNKEVVVNFIADLVCPIDPFVFAGYGTKYQNEYTECLGSNDSIRCLEIEEKYINNFINNCDINMLLDIMIDIFMVRPTQYINNLATRRKNDWDYYINLVIAEIGNRIPNKTIERLNNILINSDDKRDAIIEILSFMDINNSYELAKKIYETYIDLSKIELDMINEIKEAYKRLEISK